MRNTGRAIQDAFPFGLWLVTHLRPPRIRAGTGVEEHGRGTDEIVRASAIEAEISRETEVRKRIPAARTACGRGARRIAHDESADTRCVAENGRRADVAVGEIGIGGEQTVRIVERA